MASKNMIEAIQPIQPIQRTNRKFDYYKQIVQDMQKNAKEYGRDLVEDVFRIISIYHTFGMKIDKTLQSSHVSGEVKRSLAALKSIYGLDSSLASSSHEPTFTINRVAEAFPHVSLVIADMLDSDPSGSRLRLCVTSNDLGAVVHYHFKMHYFSALIETEANWKAQIALLVHNLCHSKGILKTSGMEIGPAFAMSCKISAGMMDLRLAPADARRKFTDYIIESFNFDANSLSRLWNQVIGETKIFLGGTLITPFHEQVLNQQPLNSSKWRDLLKQGDCNHE